MFLKIELDITLDAFTLWNLMIKLSRTLSSEWDEVVEERRRGLVDTERFSVDTTKLPLSFSIGRALPHVTDVSWRLEYQIKVKFNKLFVEGYRELSFLG